MRKLSFTMLTIGLFLLSYTKVQAASYELFDDASIVPLGNPGNAVEAVSDSDPGWGGVDFAVPAGMTFDQLTALMTDYKITSGDCGGGAPRFQINVDGKNVFVYLGPLPNFTGCVLNQWQTTGNFIGSTNAVFDLSQLGGPWYGTYTQALGLLSGHIITGIQLSVDGGWAVTGDQIVLFDNVVIGSDTYSFEPPTKSEVLTNSGVEGKGLETAAGLQKTFNENSKAEEHAGKK